MAKVRIYELAKQLNKTTKDVLDELAMMGVDGKTHSSNISEDVANKLIKVFSDLEAEEKAEREKAEREKAQREKAEREKAERERAKAEKALKQKTIRLPLEKPIQTPEETVEAQAPAEAAVSAEEVPGPVTEEPGTEVVQPAEAAARIEAEEAVTVPDKFQKELEAEKIEKFKAKPGLQRAFQTIKKIEPRKWGDMRGGHRKADKTRPFQRQDGRQAVVAPTMPRKKTIKLREGTTVKEFSELLGLKFTEVIKKFMELGYMPTINQPVDADAALLVAESFGIRVELASVEEDVEKADQVEDDLSKLVPRAPVVTIMGHVDHGKTSLLDAIRETKVTESEAGGITQHIGAYKITLAGKEIVFLDTPGHEAFTAMRARGAKVTDVVVLVVAADDGVMPQTVEAINHAKAGNVPIIVAVNKIDKPEANITRVRTELSEHGIISEEWGGQNIFVEVSAKKRIGIERLLEMILLQAEIMELKANPARTARGTVIEAKLDRGRGPVATLLVQTGTLRIGDALLSGIHVGKVRALSDDTGLRISEAGPSTPAEVIGFSEVPAAGDVFIVTEDEKKARQIALTRAQKLRSAEIAKTKKLTLDELYTRIKEGQIKELNIIIKGDVQGSVEAIRDSLENIVHPEVKVKVIHTSVGGITESDVMLAAASNAIIIGFNVRPDMKASQIAEREGVDVRMYNVIYEAIEDVKKALEGMLEPTLKEKVLGRAEVRQLFPVSRLGTIAGCYVTDGYISRASDGIRVLRDSIVVHEGKINSLKRFKEDVREAQTGYECGILLENFNDLKVGDIIENYVIEKIAAKL